jgi:hypothetical protein
MKLFLVEGVTFPLGLPKRITKNITGILKRLQVFLKIVNNSTL